MFGMDNDPGDRQNRQNSFLDASSKLAIALSLLLTLAFTPMAYEASKNYVTVFVKHNYGYDWIFWMMPIYGILIGAVIYYSTRASLVTSIMGLAVWISLKLI